MNEFVPVFLFFLFANPSAAEIKYNISCGKKLKF